MNAIDWKQIPNLEQVATLVFVSLGLTIATLLFLLGFLWGSVRSLRSRVADLESIERKRLAAQVGGEP